MAGYLPDPELEQLRQDRIVKRWLLMCNASDKTTKNYTITMRMYTDCIGMTPQTCIEEAIEDIRAGILPMQWRVLDHILEFKQCMKKQGIKDSSVKTRLTAIYSFYKWNGIIFQHVRKGKNEDISPVNDEFPDKDMIRLALNYADPLTRALILVGVSSGLSQADLVNLKIKDFKAGYDSQTGLTMLKLTRIKTNFKFSTFLTFEASKAVNDYLAWREREPKREDQRRLDQLAKQRILSDNGYLFINRHIPDKWHETKDEQLRKLNDNNIQWIYSTLCDEAGIATPKGERNIFVSHGLRKFFNNQILIGGCNTEAKEFLMGHKPKESRSFYNKIIQQPDWLKQEYTKCIPFLTIQKELDVSESDDFKRIKAENATLIVEAEKQRVERTELQNMQEEIKKLKEEKQDAVDVYLLSEHEKMDADTENSQLRKDLDELRSVLNMLLKKEGLDIDAPMTEQEKKYKDAW